jgi:two-component system phosphate regulon response regulator PhoB
MDSERPYILVADGDEATRAILGPLLRDAGYRVELVGSGREALLRARDDAYSCVVTEARLPELSGLELCRHLRASALHGRVPILILSSQGGEIDRVVGFEVGADDYLSKPFSPRELLLRLRALLRRAGTGRTAAETLRAGTLEVDTTQLRVRAGGGEIRLSTIEFRLLSAIARRRGTVVTRAALVREIWDLPEERENRMLDTHIKRLREKLGDHGGQIETVRGIGYRVAM